MFWKNLIIIKWSLVKIQSGSCEHVYSMANHLQTVKLDHLQSRLLIRCFHLMKMFLSSKPICFHNHQCLGSTYSCRPLPIVIRFLLCSRHQDVILLFTTNIILLSIFHTPLFSSLVSADFMWYKDLWLFFWDQWLCSKITFPNTFPALWGHPEYIIICLLWPACK